VLPCVAAVSWTRASDHPSNFRDDIFYLFVGFFVGNLDSFYVCESRPSDWPSLYFLIGLLFINIIII
jgi:hypothetical protein